MFVKQSDLLSGLYDQFKNELTDSALKNTLQKVYKL